MWQAIATLLGFLAHSTSAHGGALNYTVGDIWYPGFVSFHEPYSTPFTEMILPQLRPLW